MAALPGAAAVFSFAIEQGADFSIPMTWLMDDNVTPMNLTGYTMALAICPQPGASPLITLSSTSSTGSRIVLGGTAGTIELIFANADTAAFVAAGMPLPNPNPGGPSVYKLGTHDLKYVDPAGLVGYLFKGFAYLDPRSTV